MKKLISIEIILCFLLLAIPINVFAQVNNKIENGVKDNKYSAKENQKEYEGKAEIIEELKIPNIRAENKRNTQLTFLYASIAILMVGVTKMILDHVLEVKQNKLVYEAEKKAFEIDSVETIGLKQDELDESQVALKRRTEDIAKLVEDNMEAIKIGRLFNLYSKQIEKYQKSTQSRATWSFVFAIFAMFFGLGFVFWGGTHILMKSGLQNIAAGSAISAIGGGISAYITKTFLDVHKTSLNQLNRYFRQPVINEHILTAQRLADYLEDKPSRLKAYKSIISRVTGLIRNETDSEMSHKQNISDKKAAKEKRQIKD